MSKRTIWVVYPQNHLRFDEKMYRFEELADERVQDLKLIYQDKAEKVKFTEVEDKP